MVHAAQKFLDPALRGRRCVGGVVSAGRSCGAANRVSTTSADWLTTGRQRRGNRVFYMVTDEHIRRTLTDMIDHVAESEAEIVGD